jgi:two-component system sensor histidine kinase KdpD
MAIPMHRWFDLSNLTMVYLLGVVVVAIALGRGPAVLASLLGVAAFDFVFVPPRFTLQVSDAQYLVTLAVMLLVALLTGTLTARLREQLHDARRRERRAATLYRLSRELASRNAPNDLLRVAAQKIGDVLRARVAILQEDARGGLSVQAGDAALLSAEEREAARRAWEDHQIAGLDETASERRLLHLPLEAGLHTHGVLSARPNKGPWGAERLQLLRMLTSQTALALERCRLAEEAHVARAQAETERTRSALLSSVSHDLRTPLAAITGAATALQATAGMSDATRREMAETIAEEAQRLNRLIENILEMTRLESGTLRVRRDWHSLEEVVGAALARLERVLGERPLNLRMASDLPLVSLDDVLFAQVVWNLVENAHKYSPAREAIDVTAIVGESELVLEVADRGPGFDPVERAQVFEKFFRGRGASRIPGAGLGLAIAHGIVVAHRGTIEAGNRVGGGGVITVRLPLLGTPPSIEHERDDEVALRGPA